LQTLAKALFIYSYEENRIGNCGTIA
jgi:hypothetical protein